MRQARNSSSCANLVASPADGADHRAHASVRRGRRHRQLIDSLDGKHVVFGKVIAGRSTVRLLEEVRWRGKGVAYTVRAIETHRTSPKRRS